MRKIIYLVIVALSLCLCVDINAQGKPIGRPTNKPHWKPKPKPKPKPTTVDEYVHSGPAATVVTTPEVSGADGMLNGFGYVDLGLPSGVKWSSTNVGAKRPGDYGTFFAWGEVGTKSLFSESNGLTYKKKGFSDISGNTSYDVARATRGGSWRIPRKSEAEELINNCKWSWTTIDGNKGYKVTGPNGKSIFLPASGFMDGRSLTSQKAGGYYWTSTPIPGDNTNMYMLFFVKGEKQIDWYGRYLGCCVRPVSD